jgi:DNA adenine methylase
MGGKYKVARDLLRLAPPSFREFRDPFCGNASLLWFVPTTVKRWINDLNPDVYNIQRYIRDSREFLDAIHEIRASLKTGDDRVRYYWRSKFLLQFGNEFQQTLAYWYLTRVAWGQFVRRERPNIASYSWRHLNCKLPTKPKCEQAHTIIQNVKITQLDYTALLDAPGTNVWVFIDPPYFIDHHCSALYELDMTHDQHVKLAERLRRCTHKFLMTLNWNELTHELYIKPKDFRVDYRDYRYSGVIRKIQPFRKELIVRNY